MKTCLPAVLASFSISFGNVCCSSSSCSHCRSRVCSSESGANSRTECAIICYLSERCRLFVFTGVHCEEVFQFPLQCLKGGSSHWILVPTFKHDFVKSRIAVRRLRHSVPVFHLSQYFSVCHTLKTENLNKVPNQILKQSYRDMVFFRR